MDDDTYSLLWQKQVAQYPHNGPEGVGYFQGDISRLEGLGSFMDCLLYRREGVIVGILNHFPQDFFPWERKGNITVFVAHDRQRQGIGSALVREAMSRWQVNPFQQRYTEAGFALLTSLMRQKSRESNLR